MKRCSSIYFVKSTFCLRKKFNDPIKNLQRKASIYAILHLFHYNRCSCANIDDVNFRFSLFFLIQRAFSNDNLDLWFVRLIIDLKLLLHHFFFQKYLCACYSLLLAYPLPLSLSFADLYNNIIFKFVYFVQCISELKSKHLNKFKLGASDRSLITFLPSSSDPFIS